MSDETNEVSEMWRDYKSARQQKRRSNLKFSTDLLDRHSVRYVKHNGGIHLVIEGKHGPIDFWPSTGLYKERSTGRKLRGIVRLLRELGVPV